ncbi:MAG TPA: histidine phosphatase family protein [Planctomycetota bacterium]
MRVCLVRHGPAVPTGTPGIDDDARPLTPDGRVKTRAAARGIRALKLGIDAVWTSPLPRARETAEILARELRLPQPKLLDALKPGASADRLFRKPLGECPALVGHEPDFGSIVAALTGGRPDAFPVKKAGLAVLDLHRRGARPSGTLALFLRPSTLRALGR